MEGIRNGEKSSIKKDYRLRSCCSSKSETIEKAMKIADACAKAGVAAIEITFTVPRAAEVIKKLSEIYKNGEIMIGAGTVLDTETARTAILAGAQYIVSPCLNTEVVKLCNKYDKGTAERVKSKFITYP